MHLPAVVRRRIAYATVAALGATGLIMITRPSATKAERPAIAGVSTTSADKVHAANAPASAAPAPAGSASGESESKPKAQQAAARPKVTKYTVVDGDTVGAVAEKFGLKSDTILLANDMDEEDLLQIGQELAIPAADGLLYKVASGDTLWDIADLYGANVDEIIAANSDVEPGGLQPGNLLVIPGGTEPSRRMVASSRGAARPSVSHKLSIWPTTGPITDTFGWRVHPVYGTKNFHDGLDIGVGVGTPVGAASAGTVTMAQRYGGYGLTVKIDHGGGIITLYAHLSAIEVDVGQKVSAGGLIGYSGNTGVSTGPHLHFTVLVDGSPDDPESWLP